MAEFNVELQKISSSADRLIELKRRMNDLKAEVDGVKLKGIMNTSYSYRIEAALREISEKILDEAARMDSLGSALQYAVTQYSNAENAILNSDAGSAGSSSRNADSKNWWDQFWSWLTGKDKETHEPTPQEREKAADDAMKKALRDELRDFKYSRLNWTFSSVEQRKQILQDYLTAVIAIYGLQHVNATINWDNNATYTSTSITWGYYTHGNHTVTLNERALSGTEWTWDSYSLLGTVAHELRHAYQHEAVDDPSRFTVSEETVSSWRENFRNYISSDTDYQRYRDQPVERDARDFEVGRPFLGLF